MDETNLMATFSLTTQGIRCGFSREGFWASGTTDRYEFDERDWVGHDLPRLQRQPIQWSINTKGEDCWKQYQEYLYPPEKMTPRRDALNAFFNGERHLRAVGSFHKWSQTEPPLLRYSFPQDHSLAVYLTAMMQMEREIIITGMGFIFVDEPQIAPAPTVSGWMEREEPLFLWELPDFHTI